MKQFLARSLFVVALAIGVAGCGTVQKIENAYSALTSASVSPDAVIYAASAFDAVEATRTNYNRLRRCNGTNGPICRDPAITKATYGPLMAGRVARNNLKAFLRAHPGQLGPQGDYDALVAATKTVKDALAAYEAATK